MARTARRTDPARRLAVCLILCLVLPAVAARAEHPDLDRAREAARAGRFVECIAILDPLLAGELADDERDSARSWRAWSLHSLGRHDEAISEYRRLDARGMITAEDLDLMGACHEALGDLPRAFQAYGRAELKDRMTASYREHAEALGQRLIHLSDAYLPELRAAVEAGDGVHAVDIMLEAALAPGTRSSDMLVLAQRAADLCDQSLRAVNKPMNWAAARGLTDSTVVYADSLLTMRSTYGSAHAAWRNAQWALCVRNDDKTCEIMQEAWDDWTFEPKKALAQVDKAVKRQPKLPRFRLDRAVLYRRLKDARAGDEFAAAIAAGERDTGLRERSRWHLAEGRKDEALADLEAAYPLLSDASQDERTLLSEGLRLHAQRRDQAAGEAFARFEAAVKERDLATARAALEEATGRLPDSGLYRLAAAALTEDTAEQAAIVVSALAMEPDNLRLLEEGLGRLAVAGDLETRARLAVDWARRHPGTAASVQFTDLGRACADAPRALFLHCLAISLDPDNGGAWFGRADLWYGNDRIDEGIHDYEFAKSLGHPGAQEQLTYLWGIKADRSLAERRANGTLNAPPSGSVAAPGAGGASRYCMRCYGSGGIFAWEDGTDAYNRRVRVQKKITCPECMGRGVR